MGTTFGTDVEVTKLASLPAGTNNIGDVDIVTIPNVTLAAGTNTNEVVGDVAHDAVAAGNPVLVAARANLNEPGTAVADGDSTYLWADQLGRLVTIGGHSNPEPPVTANGGAGQLSVIAAPGAAARLYICGAHISNRAATENVISLREGAAGNIRFTGNFAADGGGAVLNFGNRGWQLPLNTALIADIGSATADINITEYYIAV